MTKPTTMQVGVCGNRGYADGQSVNKMNIKQQLC